MLERSPEDYAFEQCRALAAAVGAERGLRDVEAFLACFQRQQSQSGELGSIVAENGAPFELSLSSRDMSSLRLLGEATCYGESIIGNLKRNCLLFRKLNETFHLCRHGQFETFVKTLFPPGELLNQLQWKFTFYTSIRADGCSNPVFRFYFNLLWGSNEHRILRAIAALRCLGWVSDEVLRRLFGLIAGWGEVVGISLDSVYGALAPAKLHFSILRPSRYRLALLRNWLRLQESEGLLDWYLSAYPAGHSVGIPYLFSVDLSDARPPGLKIDMVLRGLSAIDRQAIVAEVSRRTDTRNLSDLVEGDACEGLDIDSAQYLGVNFAPDGAPYVNGYFSAVRPAARGETLAEWDGAALAAVAIAQSERGGYAHEGFDFGPRGREIPADGGDVYMTALVEQCLAEFWPARLPDVESKCLSFLWETKEDRGWSYLPGLPVDVDDSAMAIASLQHRAVDLPDRLFDELARQQLPSGAFRTFFDLEEDPAHFSVTANAVLALTSRRPAAAARGLGYLREALAAPSETQNQWMYSLVFPLFLLARVARRLEDATLRAEIADRLLALRREDGLWGGGMPESFETATALLTLHACGATPDKLGAVVLHLAHAQRDDGTWPWAPLYSDGDGHWFGQTAVSTLVCATALAIAKGAVAAFAWPAGRPNVADAHIKAPSKTSRK